MVPTPHRGSETGCIGVQMRGAHSAPFGWAGERVGPGMRSAVRGRRGCWLSIARGAVESALETDLLQGPRECYIVLPSRTFAGLGCGEMVAVCLRRRRDEW
jgi:hypothetical protein